MALREIKVDDDDFGLMTYDPAFMNTASCRSRDHLHRRRQGHPRVPRLSDRAARRAVDLPRGRLPARPRRAADPGAARRVDARDHDPHVRARERQELHAGLPLRRAPDGDAARLGRRALDLLSGRQRRSRTRRSATSRSIRLIAKMPTLAAFAYRHNMGQPYVYPDNDLRYPGNFLSMLYKMTELKYEPDPRLERALDILFILHADHEQNCSTTRRARGRLLAGRPVLGGRRRRRRALRPAARRRQRGGAADAAAGSRRRRTSPTSSRA